MRLDDYDEEFEEEFEEEYEHRKPRRNPSTMDNRKILVGIAGAVLALIVLLVVLIVLLIRKDDNSAKTVIEETVVETTVEPTIVETSMETYTETENVVMESEDLEDPQVLEEVQKVEGEEVDNTQILVGIGAAENSSETVGIDVSKFQGTIDWNKVAAQGVNFAMVRVGFRSPEKGELKEDSNARYNLQEATKYGIKVGVYFYSTAVTEAEAIEEANYVANIIAPYQITYPVAFDCEGYQKETSRQYNMTVDERTACAKAFMNRIHELGYTPLFYASKGELEGNLGWNTTELEKSYKMWVSWYGTTVYPDVKTPTYGGSCSMWQFTNKGHLDGISKAVDLNVAYFGYDSVSSAKSEEKPQEVSADAEALMNFRDTNVSVTSKNETNLRNIPSQGEDGKVVYTLKNGEVVTKTGESDSGWVRLSWNGQTVYAVGSLLTEDLSAPPQQAPAPQPEAVTVDGVKTPFTACDEQVTPKMEVNLRKLPSVTNPDAVVVVNVKSGEILHRVGINVNLGWSKIDYNGQTLYCVSSYLKTP